MTPPQVAYTCDELAVIRRLKRLGSAGPACSGLRHDTRERLRAALVAEAGHAGRSNVVYLSDRLTA